MATKRQKNYFNWKIIGSVAIGILLLLVAINAIASNWLSVRDLEIIFTRLPYILFGNQTGWPIEGGFAMNIFMSLMCMAIGTILGVVLGLLQITPQKLLRHSAWFITQFFRNSPWLVILFVILYLVPFELNIFGFEVPFNSLTKAIIGLSLVVMANIAEIVRGAIQSIPSGQWEAAEAMGYTRPQILRLVILPQALRRMIPPWMNWYAILTMGTTLTHLIGVSEGLTAVRQVLELEGESLAIPLYGVLMFLFFIYCYPIAVLTKKLEQKLM